MSIIVNAQTQYDYYDDDVANSKPDLDWHAILGFLILAFIGFVLWIIYTSIKNSASKRSKANAQNKIIVKQAPTLTPAQVMEKQIKEERDKRVIEWENKIKQKLREEAIEILKNEYNKPHEMDNVIYILKYEELRSDTVDAFVKGYIKGCYRFETWRTIEQIKKRYHPIVVLGYIRGLEEKLEIWEKFGKFPG